jgi:hypothetical protein
MSTANRSGHIRLTSHPEPGAATSRFPIRWGAATAEKRGPIIGSVTNPADRNVIGAHGGAYSLYRALAISARALNPLERDRIVSLDPWDTWSARCSRARSRPAPTSGPRSR